MTTCAEIGSGVTARAFVFLQREEALSLKPYRDIAGYWTVGYGHRCEADQPEITAAQADVILLRDMGPCIEAANRFKGLSEGQRVALVSLIFNIGLGAFLSSTLNRKLRAGDVSGAAAEFGRWVYFRKGAQMAVSAGLQARREREKNLFLGVENELAETQVA